jgi:hypothetical protein
MSQEKRGNPRRLTTKEILEKYSARFNKSIKNFNPIKENYSKDYVIFKKEMFPEFSRYERWCKSLGSMIKINFSKKDEEKIKKNLKISHIDIEPWQALNLGVMVFLSVFLIGLLLSFAITLIFGSGISDFPILFFILLIVFGLFLFYFFNEYPKRLANKWRLKASSQMVPAILYIVVYMKHTSNLEKAIEFASEHLQPPLSLDFKKIFYDVSIGKFSTIKESIDNYLESWKDYSVEFIEAFNLIESSLYEPDNSRRIFVLEKSLQIILDGVYDKMLKFTHEVRSPLTNVYMLGVVLPTLALALLPLGSAILQGLIKSYHVFLIFNLIVPFFVFYLTDRVVNSRPGGYGQDKLLEKNPYYSKYKSKEHYFNAFLICLPFFIIGFLPLIFQYTPLPDALNLKTDYSFSEFGINFLGDDKIFDFKENKDGNLVGPFGIGALVCGLFIPLGLALFFSISYNGKTKELIKERERTIELEKEFNSSLFQLGNSIGNGTPPERAFGKVANSSKGLITEDFFKKVYYNIAQMGMSVEKAIFDKKRGAILNYPSEIISTSMKILIESSKKGLKIAAVSLTSISIYIKNIQKITLRLKDMLAEIISDMKSNMTFLAPLLSGIVVGLGAMIGSILNKIELSSFLESGGEGFIGLGNIDILSKIFDVTQMIPPYYLQIIIGIYLIQIIFILTSTLVVINSGSDALEKTNKTGKNLKIGIFLYFITSLFASLALYLLSSFVLGV